MHTLVRKALEIYINEKRIITQGDFPIHLLPMLLKKNSVFVTLYHNWRVIASSGRIQCQKENMLYECIDNTLMCLKDPRFWISLQNPENLKDIYIRVDSISSEDRRMIHAISELNIRDEWIILLSQNHGTLSVVLPHMLLTDPTPERYFAFVCQKAWLNPNNITSSDYVLYALKTTEYTDMV